MLITKFNAMIRNRVVWGIFAVIVSISFLGFLGPRGCSGNSSSRPQGTVGKLAGKPVAESDFFRARFFEIGLREQNAPRDNEGNRQLRKQTWRRLAALETAKKLGIYATDDELAQAIGRDPSFRVNGSFNRDQYRAVISQQLRVPVEMFEEYLRESLTLRKMAEIMQSVVLTVPSELEERLKNLTDTMTVEYAFMQPDPARDRKEISEDDARVFYEEHKDLFTTPVRVQARYVSFPITNYFNAAEIDDAQVREYYEENIEKFARKGTNDVPVETPLEEVREEILHTLASDAAVNKARDAATEFELKMIPDRNGRSLSFEAAAAAASLPTALTGFLIGSDAPPVDDGAYDFVDAVFSLDTNDAERLVSDPIVGKTNVYVATISERQEARVPPFEHVRQDAMARAAESAMMTAFQQRAEESRNAVAAAVAGGRTFRDAVEGIGMNVATSVTFAVYESIQTTAFQYADALIPAVVELGTNQVSDLIVVPNGRLIACMEDRKPAEVMTLDLYRPQLLSTLENYRAGVMAQEWAESLLVQMGLEDFAPVETVAAGDAGDESGSSAERSPDKPSRDEMQQLL